MGVVKKTLGSKLLGCGGWLREKEESRARLWRSIHLGGCDNEFALNLKVELWSRQLIRSSDPLSWEWSLGVLKAHRITSPSGSAPAIFGQPLSHTTASLVPAFIPPNQTPHLECPSPSLVIPKGTETNSGLLPVGGGLLQWSSNFLLKIPHKRIL